MFRNVLRLLTSPSLGHRIRQTKTYTYSMRMLKYGVLPFQITTCSAIFLNDHVFEVCSITGRSMQPTLSPHYGRTGATDYVLWNKWDPVADLRRGDVVLYAAPHDPDRMSVKRVIGLPGDTVLLDPRRRPAEVLNGRANPAARAWGEIWTREGGRLTVPLGHVWVEGDNWTCSKDSHWVGPISKALVLGRAVGVVWPLGMLGGRPWEEGFTSRTKVVPVREGEEEELVAKWRDGDLGSLGRGFVWG